MKGLELIKKIQERKIRGTEVIKKDMRKIDRRLRSDKNKSHEKMRYNGWRN